VRRKDSSDGKEKEYSPEWVVEMEDALVDGESDAGTVIRAKSRGRSGVPKRVGKAGSG
jgi:hypothetical protein